MIKKRAFSFPDRNSGGFALISAIFLIVILAALAVFIAAMSIHQQAGHTADLQGLRAYQAARAGIEWGLYDFKRNGACTAPVSFSPGGALGAFTVTVDCLRNEMATTNDEAGTAVTVRRIVATACNLPAAGGGCPNAAPGDGYVERRLSVVAGQ
jgi:MSHA biogenesis protein MshP